MNCYFNTSISFYVLLIIKSKKIRNIYYKLKIQGREETTQIRHPLRQLFFLPLRITIYIKLFNISVTIWKIKQSKIVDIKKSVMKLHS